MALIDKEQIRAEIERRCVCENTEINRKRLNRVIIEPSKRWQPVEGLEEAARHSEILTYPMPEDGDIEKVMKAQEARIFHEIGFKAGAEWQKKRDDLETADMLAIAHLQGMEQQKSTMLEDAVEGIARPDDCEIWLNLVGYGYKFKDGDKVRVIVIKEDEK